MTAAALPSGIPWAGTQGVNPRRKIAAFDAQPNKRTERLVEGGLGGTRMFRRSLAAAERP
jgi:hypothetical protein